MSPQHSQLGLESIALGALTKIADILRPMQDLAARKSQMHGLQNACAVSPLEHARKCNSFSKTASTKKDLKKTFGDTQDTPYVLLLCQEAISRQISNLNLLDVRSYAKGPEGTSTPDFSHFSILQYTLYSILWLLWLGDVQFRLLNHPMLCFHTPCWVPASSL